MFNLYTYWESLYSLLQQALCRWVSKVVSCYLCPSQRSMQLKASRSSKQYRLQWLRRGMENLCVTVYWAEICFSTAVSWYRDI